MALFFFKLWKMLGLNEIIDFYGRESQHKCVLYTVLSRRRVSLEGKGPPLSPVSAGIKPSAHAHDEKGQVGGRALGPWSCSTQGSCAGSISFMRLSSSRSFN